MKIMHLGLFVEDDNNIERLSLPPGVVSDGDSFLVWGDKDEDRTLHLTYAYEVHSLPPEPDWSEPGNLHPHTASTPVRGWLRLQGYWDRERAEIARIRGELLMRLDEVRGVRLMDYVVLTDSDDWADDQRIWTLDGILGRCGS